MKRLSRLAALLLTLAMLLSLVSIAHAEEKQSATAWLLYFASNHETDSSKFPWWPQHKSADQPSSETGVEATNAEVTGPGMYTVGLKFNWQKAEGAIQFNLVLDNAESLFPGYYVNYRHPRQRQVHRPQAEPLRHLPRRSQCRLCADLQQLLGQEFLPGFHRSGRSARL